MLGISVWAFVEPAILKRVFEKLTLPLAKQGSSARFGLLKWADACVLVMPCGRSAHLEAGYFVGAQKPLFILLSTP
jgi:hypothetical protein